MEEWLTKTLASQFSDAARQDLVDTYCVSGGFIAVRPTDFDRCMARDDVFAGLRHIAVLQGLIEAFQPLGIRREAEVLMVRCATGEQAIHLALSLLQFKEAHPLGIAVSAGRVFQSPSMELFGEPVQRARHLVTLARPHEVLVPKEVLRELSLPQGIGVFAAPEILEDHLSFECSILRDFRSAMPMHEQG